MFKGKLIENDRYYKFRSQKLILMLLPAIPAGIIANFYHIPIWLTILMIGLYILVIVFMARNQRQMDSVLGNNIIEIDEHEIRIISKDGIQKESISLDEVEKIMLKKEYSMPQESMKEVGKEIVGKIKQNYLIIYQDKQKRKLDFEFESYYMINQLNNLIKNWKVNGYKIERIK